MIKTLLYKYKILQSIQHTTGLTDIRISTSSEVNPNEGGATYINYKIHDDINWVRLICSRNIKSKINTYTVECHATGFSPPLLNLQDRDVDYIIQLCEKYNLIP